MAPVKDITPSERIRELSDINKDVAAMLGSAGKAVNALTNRPLSTDGGNEDEAMDASSTSTIEDRKQAFEQNNLDFLEGLQGVMARLRRQAYALEEAGIVTPEAPMVEKEAPKQGTGANAPQLQRTTALPPSQKLDPDRIKNGGLGNFDVGWLNSRGNKVGAEKEAELIQEAKELLERVLEKNSAMT